MQAILVLLLAVTLSPDATKIALDRDGWIAANDDAAQATWWWSGTCAPQKLEGDAKPSCAATRAMHVRATPNAVVTWGTDAMLRDLPDDQLPSAIANEQGLVSISVPASGEIWVRATTQKLAAPWTKFAGSEARLESAPAIPLTLSLRGEDGKPVTHARVALLPMDCTRICAERLLAFDAKEMIAARGVAYRVVVWSDSHAPIARTITASSRDLAIALPAAGAVNARLVDSEHKPLRGGALDVKYRLPELTDTIHRTSATTSDGNVLLSGLPPSLIEWTAGASAFSRRVDQARLTAGATTSLGEIVLHPAREARVVVRDAAGAAIRDARVVARGSSFASTDDKGSATLRDLPPGDAPLEITAEGFLPATATLAKDERETLTITLTRGAAVKAALLRQSDGQVPKSARVRVTNNGRQQLRTVELSEGFLLSGLRGGTARLSIQVDGAQPYDTGTLRLADGEVLDLGIVTLATGFAITGTVVDDHAAPLHGARIRLLHTDGDSPALAHVLGNWSETESAEDGTFRMSGLKAGSHFVVVDARGFAQRALTGVTVSAEESSADLGTIALDPGRAIELVCRPEKRCGTEASLLIAGADYPFLAIKTLMREGRGTFNAVPSGNAT
ncbi:MAG TPA: carboxypeptidase-like regulatory domain-containing protein, partial [Thermoanaerobaculia bacterium]|nr:carboxypeptidase-like regulatory domain-containing protein [Thermoanaerobaculia bacterium]